VSYTTCSGRGKGWSIITAGNDLDAGISLTSVESIEKFASPYLHDRRYRGYRKCGAHAMVLPDGNNSRNRRDRELRVDKTGSKRTNRMRSGSFVPLLTPRAVTDFERLNPCRRFNDRVRRWTVFVVDFQKSFRIPSS